MTSFFKFIYLFYFYFFIHEPEYLSGSNGKQVSTSRTLLMWISLRCDIRHEAAFLEVLNHEIWGGRSQLQHVGGA